MPIVTKFIGRCEIGFCFAFYYLRMSVLMPEEYSYTNIMYEMLIQGGDTDTNAAIVGGLVGAYLGYNAIDKELVKKLI